MPAEECCKLVKKEIPSIDEDLYSYLESKFFVQGNSVKEKWTLRQKAARLAANSGPTRKKKTKQMIRNKSCSKELHS